MLSLTIQRGAPRPSLSRRAALGQTQMAGSELSEPLSVVTRRSHAGEGSSGPLPAYPAWGGDSGPSSHNCFLAVSYFFDLRVCVCFLLEFYHSGSQTSTEVVRVIPQTPCTEPRPRLPPQQGQRSFGLHPRVPARPTTYLGSLTSSLRGSVPLMEETEGDKCSPSE